MNGKNELLDAAFRQAVNRIPPTELKSDVAQKTIAVWMRAYGRREDADFGEGEIQERIRRGLRELAEAEEV